MNRSKGATVTAVFNGTGVSVIAEKGRNWGKASIYVDGTLRKTVDLYSAAMVKSTAVFKATGLSAGQHNVTIVATGAKNAKSSSSQINFDALDVVGTLKPAVTVSRLEQTDAHLFWDGPWKDAAYAGASAGTHRSASGSAAEMSLEFRGRGVTLVGPRGPAFGRAEIFIDGKSQGTMSAYSPVAATQRVLFSAGALADGSHTLLVRVLGTREKSATSNAFSLDALDVRGTPLTGWVRAEDNDARITHAGAWSHAANTGMSGGSYSYLAGAGGIMRARFTGSAVRIVAPRNTSYGQIEVVCDGVSRTVDLYSTKLRNRQRVLTIWGLDPAKQHELEVRTLGTKASKSTWHSATFDAIDVRGTFLQAPEVRAFQSLEEDQADVALSGGWRYLTDSGASHGRTAAAYAADQTAKVSFTGTAVRWLAPRTPSSGKARVLLDGVLVANVDLYSPSASTRQVIWQKSGLSDERHTLTIEALGTRHPSSAGTAVTLDSVQVTGVAADPARPSGFVRLQQNDARVLRTGIWASYDNSAAEGGSHTMSRDCRAATTVSFHGTSVAWIGSRAKTFGRALVYLDGKLVKTVDNYNYAPEYGRVLYRATGLSDASHTLRIRVDDDLARGSSYWVPVDAIDVVGEVNQAMAKYDHSDYRIGYTGTWTSASRSAAYGGTIRKATKTGTATMTFIGNRIDVLAETGPSWGIAHVSLDGAPAVDVDLYRAAAAQSAHVFSKSGLANGAHTVTFSWTGSKNSASKTSAVNLDAIETGGPLTGATAAARARDKLIKTAIDQLGDPYLWGATGPSSFDCSGLVLYSYKSAGVSVPRVSRDQWAACSPKNLAISQLLPGDLVFRSSPSYIHHVGIYLGNGMAIHAPSSGRNVQYSRADAFKCFGRMPSSRWPK